MAGQLEHLNPDGTFSGWCVVGDDSSRDIEIVVSGITIAKGRANSPLNESNIAGEREQASFSVHVSDQIRQTLLTTNDTKSE